jgi:DNA-binding response OmpR family regulator
MRSDRGAFEQQRRDIAGKDSSLEQVKRPTILAVDDTPQQLELLAKVLEGDGYAPALAAGGLEALAWVAKERPDLILLDVLMPGMDGMEVCRRLQADPGTWDIPVIFLTCKSDTDDLLAGFQAGAVDYVAKPFRIPELLARVRVHVDLCRARHEIKTLRGILPTCAHCKRIRDHEGTWHTLESYLTEHTEARFSHGICPDCIPVYFQDFGEGMGRP